MTDHVQTFADELRAHECLGSVADQMESWISQARNDIHNRHTRQFLKAVEWIAGRTERSLVERLTMMERLMKFDGPVVMSMSLFTGWS